MYALHLGLQGLDCYWQSLYEEAFNASLPATRTQRRAAELACSWKTLYQCRELKDREVHLRSAITAANIALGTSLVPGKG